MAKKTEPNTKPIDLFIIENSVTKQDFHQKAKNEKENENNTNSRIERKREKESKKDLFEQFPAEGDIIISNRPLLI